VSADAESLAEKFSRGEPITVPADRVERALTELWQEAGRADGHDAAGAHERPVSRAALWNVVIPTSGAASLARTKQTVDDLAPLVPVRAIMLAQPAEGDGESADAAAPAPGEGGIQATIESNVVSRASGARVVYSEEITLRGASGPASVTHFGALVRALQIPGLPTATLWADPDLPEGLLRELLPVTDRLIVDTGRCAGPEHLLDVKRCCDLARPPLVVSDLGWLRLANFRLLFAGLFDVPVGGAPLQRARRVRIQHRQGGEATALLLLAWLGHLLRWQPLEAERTPSGLRLRSTGADGGAVAADLEPTPGACGTSGIVALELWSAAAAGGPGEERFAVRRTPDNHACLTLPIAPDKMVKLDSLRDAELILAALGPAGRDPLLGKCLALAAKMAALAAIA
jgi:hypothetical protein